MKYKKTLIGGLLSIGIFTVAQAANEPPSQSPLFAAAEVAAPNIMVTLADSGAMMADVNQLYGLANDRWHQTIFMTEFSNGFSPYEERYYTVPTTLEYKYTILWRSSTYNQLYYNPDVYYKPWIYPDPVTGQMKRMPNSNTTCAKRFPDNATGDDRIAGANEFNNTPCVMMTSTAAGHGQIQLAPNTRAPARYYKYIGPLPPLKDDQIRFDTGNNPNSNINAHKYINSTSGQAKNNLFERVDIVASRSQYPKGAKRTDCAASNYCSYAEEIQNFANWYTYHRSRINAARAGIAESMAKYDDNVRVGFATTTGEGNFNSVNLNPYASTSGAKGLTKTTHVDGFATPFIKLPIRSFDKDHKIKFYRELFNRMDIGYANVASVVDTVGRYFQLPPTNRASPWLEKPGSLGGKTPSACRRSYHIVSTEGGWNDDGSYHFCPPSAGTVAQCYTASQGALSNGNLSQGRPIVGNADANLPPIYRDNVGNTLADLMTYYYIKDLQPGLDDQVAPSKDEQAYGHTFKHQRLTTFALSFGLALNFDIEQRKQQMKDNPNQTVTWQNPYIRPVGAHNHFFRINDIAHGTLNTAGDTFNGSNTELVTDALDKIMTIATSDTRSDARFMMNGSRVDTVDGTQNRIFDVIFENREQWYGDVKIYTIDDHGEVSNTGLSAATKILNDYAGSKHTARNVWTWQGSVATGNAVKFDQNLSDQWKKDLLGKNALDAADQQQARKFINYIRGDNSEDGTTFRDRKNRLLGDIVNSLGVVTSHKPEVWRLLDQLEGLNPTDSGSYAYYLKNHKNNKPRPILYVGANDGMFHVIDSQDAKNIFSYVPKAVRYYLKDYASKDFEHRFYVDGVPKMSDIKFEHNGRWGRIVVGTLGAGGKGLFALDATDANQPKVLWDIEDKDLTSDPYLGDSHPVYPPSTNIGYIQGPVQIDRLTNGEWVVITGNGYDVAGPSGKRTPALLVLRAYDGKLIHAVPIPSTQVINNQANGLGAATVIISQEKGQNIQNALTIDGAYAGDMNGNMWRFDLRDHDPNNWKATLVAKSEYPDPTNGKKMIAQPITTAPVIVSPHSGAKGIRLFWGTGNYLTVSDHGNRDIQSFYGVWDKWDRENNTSEPVIKRSDLSAVTIFEEEVRAGINPDYPADKHTIRKIKQTNSKPWGKGGWVMDLNIDGKAADGERVIYSPLFIPGGGITFNSTTPNDDACSGGVTNRSYALTLDGEPAMFLINKTRKGSTLSADEAKSVGSLVIDGGFSPVPPNVRVVINENSKISDPTTPPGGGNPQLSKKLTENCPVATRPVEIDNGVVSVTCLKDGLSGWLQLQ